MVAILVMGLEYAKYIKIHCILMYFLGIPNGLPITILPPLGVSQIKVELKYKTLDSDRMYRGVDTPTMQSYNSILWFTSDKEAYSEEVDPRVSFAKFCKGEACGLHRDLLVLQDVLPLFVFGVAEEEPACGEAAQTFVSLALLAVCDAPTVRVEFALSSLLFKLLRETVLLVNLGLPFL